MPPASTCLVLALTQPPPRHRGYNVGDEDMEMTFDQFKARVRGRVTRDRSVVTDVPWCPSLEPSRPPRA